MRKLPGLVAEAHCCHNGSKHQVRESMHDMSHPRLHQLTVWCHEFVELVLCQLFM